MFSFFNLLGNNQKENTLTESTISTDSNKDNNDMVIVEQVNLFDTYMSIYLKSQNKTNKFYDCDVTVTENKDRIILRYQVAFLVDGTGSMGPYITSAREHIKKFIYTLRTEAYNEIKTKYPDEIEKIDFVYELAFVAYRDFTDSTQFEVLDFTIDIEKVHTFLDNIVPNGGGDEPEDVEGAFIHALFGIKNLFKSLSWTQRGDVTSRDLIWLADAPPHGKEFNNNTLNDNYNYESTSEWKEIMNKVKELDIDLYIIKLNNRNDKAIATLKSFIEDKNKFFEVDISQEINLFTPYLKATTSYYSDSIKKSGMTEMSGEEGINVMEKLSKQVSQQTNLKSSQYMGKISKSS